MLETDPNGKQGSSAMAEEATEREVRKNGA